MDHRSPKSHHARGLIPGWSDDQIVEEYANTDGCIIPMGQRHRRDRPLRADYVLEVNGVPVTLVEAKRTRRSTADGVAQAKQHESGDFLTALNWPPDGVAFSRSVGAVRWSSS